MKQLHHNKDLTKVVLSDIEEIQNDKRKFQSPIIKNLIEVKITNVTSIFIPIGKNKEQAKQRFLENHKHSIF